MYLQDVLQIGVSHQADEIQTVDEMHDEKMKIDENSCEIHTQTESTSVASVATMANMKAKMVSVGMHVYCSLFHCTNVELYSS